MVPDCYQKTSRVGLLPLRGLDTTKEQGKILLRKTGLKNREVLNSDSQLAVVTAYLRSIPSNFSLSLPILRRVETVFLIELKGIVGKEAPCRVPPCRLLGALEFPAPFPLQHTHCSPSVHVEGWIDKRIDERILWGCPRNQSPSQALPSDFSFPLLPGVVTQAPLS